MDPETGFSRKVIWLPPGTWFDLNTHEQFDGGYWYCLYYDLMQIPVFAQPGAIIPLDNSPVGIGGDLP